VSIPFFGDNVILNQEPGAGAGIESVSLSIKKLGLSCNPEA